MRRVVSADDMRRAAPGAAPDETLPTVSDDSNTSVPASSPPPTTEALDNLLVRLEERRALAQGMRKDRFPGNALDLDASGAVTSNKFKELPGVGSWPRPPLELATLRLQNMVGISLANWDALKPDNLATLTQLSLIMRSIFGPFFSVSPASSGRGSSSRVRTMSKRPN